MQARDVRLVFKEKGPEEGTIYYLQALIERQKELEQRINECMGLLEKLLQIIQVQDQLLEMNFERFGQDKDKELDERIGDNMQGLDDE